MKNTKIQLVFFAFLDIVLGTSEIYELLHDFNDPILLFCSLCAIAGVAAILLCLKGLRYHRLAEIFSYINIVISAISLIFAFIHRDPLMEKALSIGELAVAVYVHILLGRLHQTEEE